MQGQAPESPRSLGAEEICQMGAININQDKSTSPNARRQTPPSTQNSEEQKLGGGDDATDYSCQNGERPAAIHVVAVARRPWHQQIRPFASVVAVCQHTSGGKADLRRDRNLICWDLSRQRASGTASDLGLVAGAFEIRRTGSRNPNPRKGRIPRRKGVEIGLT
ncbi:hypothetical protein VDGL01_06422 [Verticillium dahliae]